MKVRKIAGLFCALVCGVAFLTKCASIQEYTVWTVKRMEKRMENQSEYGKLSFYSTVKPVAQSWVWYPYIAAGKLSLLSGDPGDGKTALALTLAAHITTGRALPETEHTPVCGSVIYQTNENGAADAVVPRLIAAGADCSKVAFIDMPDFDLAANRDLLELRIQECGAKAVFIDPLQDFISGVDMGRAMDMRRIMSGLVKIAERTGCAIVCIGHNNKASGAKSLYRGLGSIDIAATARSVLTVHRVEKNITVLSQIKNSLARDGESLMFEIGDDAVLNYLGIYEEGEDGSEYLPDSKRDLAADLILNMLSDGDKRAAEVFDACKERGIQSRTVESAKKDLGVRSRRDRDGWYWSLDE